MIKQDIKIKAICWNSELRGGVESLYALDGRTYNVSSINNNCVNLWNINGHEQIMKESVYLDYFLKNAKERV